MSSQHRGPKNFRVANSGATDTDVSWKLGGGGFISNIDDLAKFAAGLLGDKLVRNPTKTQMWTRQKTRDGKTTKYGLGFSVGGSGAGLRVSHSGAQEKTRTLMVLHPAKKLGIVVMTNSEHASAGQFASRLEALQ